jgi:hypothetical protein
VNAVSSVPSSSRAARRDRNHGVTTYIDFECIGAMRAIATRNRAAAAHPVLLGVLREDEGGWSELHQVILDPCLASARVALGRLTVDTLGTALRRLVGQDTAPIVSWSTFDLAVIDADEDVPAALRDSLRERHVNALTIGRTWRRVVRPSIELPRDETGAVVHELKAYMRAAGIRPPRALTPPRPAAWARYVLDRLAANDGSYRSLKPPAKTAWHKLLEYNRLDCEGLRAVYTRAVRELALWDAYRHTTYVVALEEPILIRIGWNPRRLGRLLQTHNVSEWAFVTAWNPGSVALPAAENARRNEALAADLRRRWTLVEGQGAGDDGTAPPEASFLVLGIGREAAVATARRYGQLAIVSGTLQTGAELVPCEPPIC